MWSLRPAMAAAALLLWVVVGLPGTALAQCSPDAAVVTCSGVLGPIAKSEPPVGTLNVNGIVGNIAAGGAGEAGVALNSLRAQAATPGSSFVDGTNGSNGASSGAVTINLQGAGAGFVLSTADGIGIEARSIGAAGQNGGAAEADGVPLVPTFGGHGGLGGNGNNVAVTTTGSGLITTGGNDRHGILGLSKGGAGGNGGAAEGVAGVTSVAGDGKNGGSPGNVTINNVLNITTAGTGSAGIWAQSIGAPGGHGGAASGSLVDAGGDGAAASSGGTVSVTTGGIINTTGWNAYGIYAQSVGGFSGNGGGAYGVFSFGGGPSSAGNGGLVTVETLGGSSITTIGQNAAGIYAQSVGGGGGAGGTGAGLIGFGGSGGGGGGGQNVTVTNRSVVSTSGPGAGGIVAQSVGGGGGAGGTGVGVAGIGGDGGAGGNGGVVNVQNSANVTVRGNGDGFELGNYGIFAQSVGGGGGSANVSAGLFAFGGKGGAAGNGGDVTVGNTAEVRSECINCRFAGAIYAQSVGGGGGRGGGAAGLISMGGSGGGGGSAGEVRVTNTNTLVASGQFSRGIFAQSIGGGGGDGGFGGGLFTIGGSGAAGGEGKFVGVTNSGNITTSGPDSAGIFAQSVGGGGGNGGNTIAAGVFVAMSFGGTGGPGGRAGNVDVNREPFSASTIQTSGDRSVGILAQSIGGGGGNGGFAISASAGLYGSVSLAFGGKGGSGGAGGDVYVGANGAIITNGSFSSGIVAESIGGGGGRGGFAISAAVGTLVGVAVSFGADGGAGGSGGIVEVNNAARISTGCDACTQSNGIFASSIGGGGGTGGFSIAAAGGLSGGIGLSFGGDGGTGNFAQGVKVTSNVADPLGIQTRGSFSSGIVAQSVGGGGGNASFAASATFSIQGANANMSFGGDGGDGSRGGVVDVGNTGNITTGGAFSHGIFAQSVGGGGGTGGFAGALAFSLNGAAAAAAFGGDGGTGSDGADVTVRHSGNILTTGNQSNGILAQSIGGGGGTGGFSISAAGSIKTVAAASSMGGDGGNGGISGKVSVIDVFGSITTRGEQSHGILAQSVAGGGGTGGFSIAAAFSLESDAYGNSVGGTGGTAKNAGEVVVVSNAVIDTGGTDGKGFNSHGILAQSIGGGGGTAGFSGTAVFSLKGDAAANSTGGDGSLGGTGANVTVTSNGAITTRADKSIGIFAQSVGGGGGAGGFSVGAGVSVEGDGSADSTGGKGGAAGGAGEVRVAVNADIDTHGALSHGVLAQSVGGGGGFGGFSIGAGFSMKADSKVDSVGGDGSGGGAGNYVEVIVGNANALGVPHIHTRGEGSIGVLAQSIGGGGGAGGFAGGLSLAIDGSAENDVGGGGGGVASIGGQVKVNNFGTITTEGNNAAGIMAQSVGGGGGVGGFSIAATFEAEGDGAKNSVGGDAAGGGAGGQVDVLHAGVIETSGDFSHGIIAQSIGGGGGSGGFSIAGTLSDGGSGATGSVGGTGGEGGAGGKVTVNNTGSINVTGQNSVGIFAQSVGGGGGSGGFAGAIALGGGGVDNVVGGSGSKGGNGGDVTVISTGSIHTALANSSGVVAQSIGGGGGWGGFSLGIGDGGGGSSGIKVGLGAGCPEPPDTCDLVSLIPIDGSKGKVTVTINGETNITEGELSFGMVAQSIAGGGGIAATVILDELLFSGSDVEIIVGGNGSLNGNGLFQPTNYNTLATTMTGLGSIGLISQSIGGGGGVNAFAANALVLNPALPPEDSFLIRVGGYSAGLGFDRTGSGGGFQMTAEGTVTTTNHNAIGIVAQTIGGGGGVGNISVETITNPGEALDIVLGGSQLTNFDAINNLTFVGDAGAASTVTAEAQITTGGALSHGLVAQSIGGGGGIANVVFVDGVTLTEGTTIHIGSGAGGSGGLGGAVTANATGITTTGAGAFGIVAQSIGGGGGLTGVYSGGTLLGQDGFSLAPITIAAGGGAGGNGGAATVNSTGDVHTTGFGAHGIVAQSIGGGGGIVGNGMFATTLGAAGDGPFAGSVGGLGNAAAVGVTQTRNVVVMGQSSVGIFGQSAGGTGGLDGNVALNINHAGTNGNGVGLVWAAHGSGAAVQIADGLNNTLTSNGTLYGQASLLGGGLPLLNGMAILGGDGNDVVTNLARTPAGANDNQLVGGTRTSNIIGNVDLGGGANGLVNQSGALFITDASIILGAGNLFGNEGLLSPGDRARVKETDVTGNFDQADSGAYYIDIDLNAQNTPALVTDLMDMTGSAAFDGEGPLLLLSINKAFSNAGYVIAHADGGMTDNGFTPTLTPAAVGFIFSAEVQGADLVLLAEKPPILDLLQDPASGTTDPNVWSMGEGLDNIEQAIGIDDPFNYLINLLRLQPDAEALGDAVTTLTPHQAPHIFELADRRATEFLDRTISGCEDSFAARDIDDLVCLWGSLSGGQYNRGIVNDSPTAEDKWTSLAFGGDVPVNDNLNVGFGVGLDQVASTHDRDGMELSSMNGQLYQASASAEYHSGGFGVGFVAAGSFGDMETARRVQVDGFEQGYSSFDGIATGVAEVGELPAFSDKIIEFEGIDGYARSDAQIYGFYPRLRLSYASPETDNGAQAIGMLDIDGHLLHTPERTETGVGLANLTYPEMTHAFVTLTPGLELRLSSQMDNGFVVSGFVRGGVQWSPMQNQWVAETQFEAAPEGLPPIEIIEPFDDLRAKLDVGLVMTCPTSGMRLSANYAGVYGATTTSHEFKGSLSFPIGGPAGGC
ncbi:autotransporter outer membrane beta-barrel domain-containing protein [Devosia sp. LjRoot16]|uniref:hypothetical protein n=1 Tax=Devosia sp. LjRoot16 TaxID=3342271 RepID=UPI003ECEF565